MNEQGKLRTLSGQGHLGRALQHSATGGNNNGHLGDARVWIFGAGDCKQHILSAWEVM